MKKKKKIKLTFKELIDKTKIGLLFFALFIGALGGLFTIIWISFTPIIGQDLSLADFLRTETYGAVSNSWQDSEFVESLAYLCSLKNSSREQVFCVYHFLDENMGYEYHHRGTNILRKSPEEAIELSGVCRDVSVLVCSVTRKMGFECDFIYPPEHIYNIVITEEDICEIDITQSHIFCYSKGGKERIDLNIQKS